MKIGIVVTVSYSSGGIYQYTKSVLEALHENSAHTHIIYLSQNSLLDLSFINKPNWSVKVMDDSIITENQAVQNNVATDGIDVIKPGFNTAAHNFFSASGINLLIYPAPWSFSFECGIPYVIAIHDLQHRLQPEFPEVSADGTWQRREYLFRNAVRYAEGVLVDSETGKEDVLHFYGDLTRPEKIFPLPFIPAFTSSQISQLRCDEVRKKYQLPGSYLFYPAQFWRHKNHARLIQAIYLLKSLKGLDIPLVLSGSNTGPPHEAREQVFHDAMALAQSLKIADLVRYIGYVPEDDIVPLYTMASALVMPTFFGPTNIPILEAWACKCPVLTSDIRGVREQVGDAGILVDPNNPESIAEGMYSILFDQGKCSKIIANGCQRIGEFTKADFSRRLMGIIDNLGSMQPMSRFVEMGNRLPLLTAIVSTYNNERFISGCLEDLVNQTLFAQGKLEIIVVDSGSQQDEKHLVWEYQQKYPEKIRYIRSERESLYAAWNRGIAVASGKYVTNANTDDRHRNDALELLCRTLDEFPDVDLVYGDCYVSLIDNETFEQNAKTTIYRYPDFFPPSALLHYQLGPQPVWRRSVHEKIGLFDPTYRAAGDYDFNLRFALACKAVHVRETLGLYLKHPNAISYQDNTMSLENTRFTQKYRVPETILNLYKAAGITCDSPETQAMVFLDMGIRALEYYPPWSSGKMARNPEFASECFLRAAELKPGWATALNNLAIVFSLAGKHMEALEILNMIPVHAQNDVVRQNSTELLTRSSRLNLVLIRSELNLPSEKELSEGTIRVNQPFYNQGFLDKQREFWNVDTMFDAMFERVVTDNNIKSMTHEEKLAFWNSSINSSISQILNGIPIQPQWKILEIGCGVGRLIKPLRDRCSQVDGVDIAENMIVFAKQYLADGKQNGRLYLNNGADFSGLSDNFYDFVYSMIVFQHIRSASVVMSYFQETYRVLKPTGYFRLQVAHSDMKGMGSFNEEAEAGEQYGFLGNGYTSEQLSRMLEAARFTIIEITEAGAWLWATVQKQP